MGYADSLDAGDYLVNCPACMHDHRQFKFTRKFQLFDEIKALLFGIESFDKKIQSTFANCIGFFLFNPGTQGRNMFVAMRA